MHILATRCIDFETYATAVCIIMGLYGEKHMNNWKGAAFMESLHPADAQNKTLISKSV